MSMKPEEKLTLGLIQVENLISLLEDNQWYSYMYPKLSNVKYELKRQLSLLDNQSSSH